MENTLKDHILKRHQQHPGKIFFGDFDQPNKFAKQNGIEAIQKVYDDLVKNGQVKQTKFAVVNGVSVPHYQAIPQLKTTS